MNTTCVLLSDAGTIVKLADINRLQFCRATERAKRRSFCEAAIARISISSNLAIVSWNFLDKSQRDTLSPEGNLLTEASH